MCHQLGSLCSIQPVAGALVQPDLPLYVWSQGFSTYSVPSGPVGLSTKQLKTPRRRSRPPPARLKPAPRAGLASPALRTDGQCLPDQPALSVRGDGPISDGQRSPHFPAMLSAPRLHVQTAKKRPQLAFSLENESRLRLPAPPLHLAADRHISWCSSGSRGLVSL